MADRPLRPETLAAQALGWTDAETGAVVTPIHLATTFVGHKVGAPRERSRLYIRSDNPTFDQPEALIAALEGGAAALLFASGMAAGIAPFQALAPGDHVVAARDMYWGMKAWLMEHGRHWGLQVDFVDMTSLEALGAAVRPGVTKLVWAETPANPLWEVTDIAAVAAIAHRAGALLAVDSTCASPVLTRPLEHGADLVMHSATKYLNGHSDVLAGVLITAKTDAFWERVAKVRSSGGAMLGSFEAWLLTRGLRTLFPRVRLSSASALTLAEHFERHPAVLAVSYPGLRAHAQHAIAGRQMTGGFGGMLSIRVRGREAAARHVAASTRVWKQATSLGGVESLIEHRASVEGPNSTVPADLLRLSTGLEAAEDLIADLERALSSAAPALGAAAF